MTNGILHWMVLADQPSAQLQWKQSLLLNKWHLAPTLQTTLDACFICRDVLVSSVDSDITYEGLLAEMKDICRFDEQQPFTMKWVDEEGEK